MDEVRQELERLERLGWDSLCDGTGARFYGRTMTGDGVMVLANGMVMDRTQVVAALEDAPPWAGYELRDVRVVPVGPAAAAALVYVGSAHRDDGSTITAAMTSLYVREDEQWRLALYTQTPLAA